MSKPVQEQSACTLDYALSLRTKNLFELNMFSYKAARYLREGWQGKKWGKAEMVIGTLDGKKAALVLVTGDNQKLRRVAEACEVSEVTAATFLQKDFRRVSRGHRSCPPWLC